MHLFWKSIKNVKIWAVVLRNCEKNNVKMKNKTIQISVRL